MRLSARQLRRFKKAGLSIAEADALVPELAAYLAEPRTNDEIEAWFDERLGVLPRPGVWWALRHYGPYVHAPVEGAAWTFATKRTMVVARSGSGSAGWEVALPVLVRRYLEGFGPASIADFASFVMLTREPIRAAFAALADELVTYEGPDGATLYDVRHVAGVWRLLDDTIEATAFERLDDDTWAALETEATSLIALLAARDPGIYRRHHHWWDHLPAVDVRRLGR